ncbi:hypothetical protein BGW80DRAFT_419531 [Lactifluus volemus]|nr:hypothetical protein BGW80DRAFT_419531 [Lactifluus volemus]
MLKPDTNSHLSPRPAHARLGGDVGVWSGPCAPSSNGIHPTSPGPSRWIARRHLGIQPHTSIHHKFGHAALNLTHIPATATADHYHCFLPNPSPSELLVPQMPILKVGNC